MNVSLNFLTLAQENLFRKHQSKASLFYPKNEFVTHICCLEAISFSHAGGLFVKSIPFTLLHLKNVSKESSTTLRLIVSHIVAKAGTNAYLYKQSSMVNHGTLYRRLTALASNNARTEWSQKMWRNAVGTLWLAPLIRRIGDTPTYGARKHTITYQQVTE